ncbi:Hypothetical protein BHY_0868 [Borrelia nietonii YOR]|uniref:Lipoprotein n=1 Tax=Borrelia nietonii YOR TaxID=1293576 RepID=A0ABM5PIT0_9SPIR|nr:Hypothetical protein BHY_0868 [Borrelia nietonii YOR]
MKFVDYINSILKNKLIFMSLFFFFSCLTGRDANLSLVVVDDVQKSNVDEKSYLPGLKDDVFFS